MNPILELRGVTKAYRGIPAVKDVSFSLMRGEIHGLLGENGAGKSTLTKIIAGAVQPTSGEVVLEGKPVAFGSPKEARSAGIVMVYQENSLVPALTVAQNIFLGTEGFFNRIRRINIAAQQLLQSLNFNVDPAAAVSALGAAQRQMVEIARAVHQKARIIIFDEPTASLTPEEKHHFFGLMRRLKQAGVSLIFISHALEEVLQHADRLTVLRDGARVATGDVRDFDREAIIRAMVGRSLSQEIYGGRAITRAARRPGRKLLSVQNLSMGAMVRNTSFSVFAGQVTGMFGLIGSGRTETAKVIAGVLKRDLFHGGEIKLEDRPVRYRTPRQAVRDGIVYVTEDRKLEGFFETMSIAANINIGAMAAKTGLLSLVSAAETHRQGKAWIEALNIRAINGDASVIELSGGNQQKVVIAKSLAQEPKLVIFDEPTRGVDVGAIVEIHQIINALAAEGRAVIVISSYLPEVLSLSDRILVMRQGRVVEEFDAEEANEERIMYAAVH
ncbi:sugar ABC transporter ATP-binding protein [Rhodoligotrophos defluvii]|uniref:sugar ABC transporter ATP-binding protein n=1 Tax=Rhodoligotrophos defluvii TaxID=2561934 RepID=UPI0010C99CAF|nr:sugar ABC transporter ATP-binding protein [Rhodoligotrophos defluvii]